ncbi:hypothetical protein [Helicobacter mesocricetorum]|uniref:hypothetical protein n=1 Tax=Helicobacter mesocricetorum TaxID=87012 RepID=UPI000CF18118|nr:hypothetical protein [Helicobacter mesocricetorum]
MNRNLQELTKKLETIKESWQIYEIFEEAKKRFNEEYKNLQKDREELIQTFNEISAKNALLNVQNDELEQKNKALAITLEQKLQALKDSKESIHLKDDETKTSFSSIKAQLDVLGDLLLQTNINLPPKPTAVKKLEVSYQNYKKLLATPANDYVPLQEAMELFNLLQQLLEHIQTITLEYSKISLEITHQENKEDGS